VTVPPWPSAATLRTERLELEPLRADHADELAVTLDDQQLHRYIGGQPATREQLRERYTRLVVGHSADHTQGWCNWIARDLSSGMAVGTVQATLLDERRRTVAQIAWVVGTRWQGQGYATEAASAMCDWLLAHGVDVLTAYVHPEHQASMGVARHLGLAPTDDIVDGEIRWTT
jgi:RimJ/RimL family protein N-acetyltransferase